MMSNQETETVKENCDFGKRLSEARKAQNYSISDINEHIKIPEALLESIEASDVASLPEATFTRGYIRVYARFLEIPEQDILNAYNRAAPDKKSADLRLRSNLNGGASSQSPVIKLVTLFLILAGIAAVIYGGYQYYQKKADVMENELESKEQVFSGNSLDSPGKRHNIEQNARLTEDDELLTGENTDDLMAQEMRAEQESEPMAAADETAMDKDTISPDMQESGSKEDVIEFFAKDGSWMEVRDANDVRLFYNMLAEGGRKNLKGQAPFSVSMGNARSTQVVINGVEVDLMSQIRANNTARFTVSNEQQKIIFH